MINWLELLQEICATRPVKKYSHLNRFKGRTSTLSLSIEEAVRLLYKTVCQKSAPSSAEAHPEAAALASELGDLR